jgi:DNA-binding NarL/FixJ family response regulator
LNTLKFPLSAGSSHAGEAYHPYLVFIETNCWYELTAWKLAQYRAKYRRMEICVFTYDRLLPAQAAGLMRGGADSFLDLRDDDEVTRAGIARIVRGDVYMPEWVSEAGENEQEGPGEHPGLTRRDEIAHKMGVSYGMAKNYLSALRRKLGVKRTGMLSILAIRAGLVGYDELVNPEIGLEEA